MILNLTKKVGLGTVQFGLDYGVSNKTGQVPVTEVQKILSIAGNHGVRFVDTAPAYGTSESLLGELETSSFSVITKTMSLGTNRITKDQIDDVEGQFELSLKKLKKNKIYGLLVHKASDLLAINGNMLFDRLLKLKDQGKVERIGVSVYDRDEIDKIMNTYPIDLIQVPINIFDQRLYLDGTLKELSQAGIEIHARSVFLQGLMLMDPQHIPDYFDPIKSHFIEYHNTLNRLNFSPLEASLSYVLNHEFIASAIIGVETAKQFKECLSSIQVLKCDDFSEFALSDERYIDPRLWKLSVN